MDYFEYRDQTLCCEGVSAPDLAARFGTPLYVYSQRTFSLHFDRVREAFRVLDPLICFG